MWGSIAQRGAPVFGRRRTKAHGQLFRAELAQALTHLHMAGTHAATGLAGSAGAGAARLRGRWHASLAAFAPVIQTAREEARREARRETRRAARAVAKSKKSKRS